MSAERTRIAREMHDIVAHNLSVMIALTDGAALTVDRDPARAREAIGHASATGRAALAEMRNTFALLRSGPDEGADLMPEPGLSDVEVLIESARSTGLHVMYSITGSADRLSATVQLAVFRLVQEGITNTLKHASRATRLRVSIRCGQADLRIVIDDDGGATVASTAFGHGLIGMRERVSLHSGRLSAGPTGSGWRVTSWIPLHDSGEERGHDDPNRAG